MMMMIGGGGIKSKYYEKVGQLTPLFLPLDFSIYIYITSLAKCKHQRIQSKNSISFSSYTNLFSP